MVRHWLLGTKNGAQKHAEGQPVLDQRRTTGSTSRISRCRKPSYSHLYLSGAASGSSAISLHDGSMTSPPPAGEAGDTAPLLPASSPCSRMTAQWTAGAASNPLCDTNNNTYEATSLTYTTAPMQADTSDHRAHHREPVGRAQQHRRDAVAVLSEVEPSGSSNQLTAGYLLASQRAVDPALSTYGPKHLMIRPWHPFTKESQKAVTPNEPTEYKIEIYPSAAVVKAGNRLRLTIGTANTFTTLTPLPDLGNELGGTITLLHDSKHPSNLLLPIAP